MGALVSVVVPVYNVSKYVEKCILSITGQSYRDLQIVVVDDGSTDDSGQIVERLSGEDTRIQVIHRENGGLSQARNTGIEAAKGEYLCFVDSDDCLESDYVEKLLKQALKTGADLVICGYLHEDEQGKVQEEVSFEQAQTQAVISGVEAMKKLDNIFRPEYLLMVVAWNKLYRKELFADLRFPVMIHEDEGMIHRILNKSDKVAMVEEKLYHYLIREDAITGSKNYYDKKHLQILDAFEERIQICSDEKYKDFYENIILCYFEMCIQLMLRYREEEFRKLRLNSYFRKCAGRIYFIYFFKLSNYYKKEYLWLLLNPLKYREKIISKS